MLAQGEAILTAIRRRDNAERQELKSQEAVARVVAAPVRDDGEEDYLIPDLTKDIINKAADQQ